LPSALRGLCRDRLGRAEKIFLDLDAFWVYKAFKMTTEEFTALAPDNQKICYVLLEILRELKGINRSVSVELEEHERASA
jgi:hypothetical protein